MLGYFMLLTSFKKFAAVIAPIGPSTPKLTNHYVQISFHFVNLCRTCYWLLDCNICIVPSTSKYHTKGTFGVNLWQNWFLPLPNSATYSISSKSISHFTSHLVSEPISVSASEPFPFLPCLLLTNTAIAANAVNRATPPC